MSSATRKYKRERHEACFTPLANVGRRDWLTAKKKGIIAVLVLLVVFLAGRIYESQRGPALHRWHTWSANEMSAEEIDQATFAQYLAREKTIFADLQREVTEALPEEDKTPVNRFLSSQPGLAGAV